MTTRSERRSGVKYISTPKGYIIVDENKPKEISPWAQLVKTPKRYVMAMLLLLTLLGEFNSSAFQGLGHLLLAVCSAAALDLGFSFAYKKKIQLPDGGIITGLIIALVLSTSTPAWVTFCTVAVAILSKHLVKVKKKPIFNPAAFGLLFSLIVFSNGQSWWGSLSLLPVWLIVFVFVTGYLVTSKVNKFPQVFAFLGVYFAIFTIMSLIGVGDVADALRAPFVNSALFLAFFMVTDPPTSPAKYKDQIKFGLLAGAISTVDYLVFGGLAYLLIGLLLANAWKAWKTANKKVMKKAA
ncbi:RnfABCDGE type electron transport complex subunit D [Priestia megaterium]|uniref:RnfABCDGE type electron transport complex subunit D n=1 Tax=Priestia megaterium TaxID=1404 RepID=UPI0020798CF3|nr:RnfABCDGE type electron transport complex subunit D [Priestia megaterium]USL30902.1 RnfABCDGE type electron transport complex subunit D [Priestia megaterium]